MPKTKFSSIELQPIRKLQQSNHIADVVRSRVQFKFGDKYRAICSCGWSSKPMFFPQPYDALDQHFQQVSHNE